MATIEFESVRGDSLRYLYEGGFEVISSYSDNQGGSSITDFINFIRNNPGKSYELNINKKNNAGLVRCNLMIVTTTSSLNLLISAPTYSNFVQIENLYLKIGTSNSILMKSYNIDSNIGASISGYNPNTLIETTQDFYMNFSQTNLGGQFTINPKIFSRIDVSNTYKSSGSVVTEYNNGSSINKVIFTALGFVSNSVFGFAIAVYSSTAINGYGKISYLSSPSGATKPVLKLVLDNLFS